MGINARMPVQFEIYTIARFPQFALRPVKLSGLNVLCWNIMQQVSTLNMLADKQKMDLHVEEMLSQKLIVAAKDKEVSIENYIV